MIAIAVLIACFIAGYFVKSILWRIVSAIGIVIVAGSLWGESQKSIPQGMYSESLAKEQLGVLIIAIASPLIAFVLGIVIRSRLDKAATRHADEQISHGLSVDGLVDLIDKGLGSVVGVNNPWAQSNWHALDYADKMQWVVARRSFLGDMARAENSIDLISALQKADYKYKEDVGSVV